MTQDFGVNQGLVEELYLRWQSDPESVDVSWREYFEGLGGGPAPRAPKRQFTASIRPEPELLAATELQGRVSALVYAYRMRGHLFADLDPLGLLPKPPDELSLERFGLDHVEPETLFATGDLAGPATLPLRAIVERLQQTYCRSIGAESTYMDDRTARAWLQGRMESTQNRLDLSRDEQLRILTKLTDAEIFEQFLHTNFVGAKRFSGEGGESLIPMLELVIEQCGRHGVEEIVIGMAHRARLNVLANVLDKNVREIFAKFEDHHPEHSIGRGDVKYHLGYSSDRTTPSGRRIHLTLAFNPSHLEWVNPVVEGRARAKQDRRGDTARTRVLPLVIHGDAAFAGQGVNAETLNLSELRGYSTGGTLHVVVNNQIGFTTSPEDGRSSRYATDIVRMLRCPVFHVNGEDPEAVAQVVRLAMDYRQLYHRDVVIDMYCYRRYGHNEADEPRFTQPLMYAAIDKHPSVREVYVRRLVETGKITEAEATAIAARQREVLEQALADVRKLDPVAPVIALGGVWKGYCGGADEAVADVSTGVPIERLRELLDRITTVPAELHVHKGVKRTVLDARRDRIGGKKPLDWGTAEHLALASLLADGTPVRLTGQDCRRGTFSHRHAAIFDTTTGAAFVPLANLSPAQARFELADSPLSEAGALGFEYGYSLDYPDALVIWEAQFGDFANCAQVIIDQFLASGEDKWDRLNGLVLLLPHGFEGQGPEHSSARLERFLALAAEDNMQVCDLTTPANYFHALRRQVLRPLRKPLVVMSPKSLLRSPRATSTLDELATGGFQRIIGDQSGSPAATVRRVLVCAGKLYYELAEARDTRAANDVHIVRFEQLYPLRPAEVRAALAPYPDGTDLVWVQEAPFNMGAWYYLNARLPAVLERRLPLRCVCRPESASPATGSLASHQLEQRALIDEALAT